MEAWFLQVLRAFIRRHLIYSYLGDDPFAKPLAPWPPKKETITIRVDSDVLGWFKRQGTGYQTRMNQVLRRYMDVAGQQRVRHADQTRRKTSTRQKTTSKRVR